MGVLGHVTVKGEEGERQSTAELGVTCRGSLGGGDISELFASAWDFLKWTKVSDRTCVGLGPLSSLWLCYCPLVSRLKLAGCR